MRRFYIMTFYDGAIALRSDEDCFGGNFALIAL
jgi:hypothetical protein